MADTSLRPGERLIGGREMLAASGRTTDDPYPAADGMYVTDPVAQLTDIRAAAHPDGAGDLRHPGHVRAARPEDAGLAARYLRFVVRGSWFVLITVGWVGAGTELAAQAFDAASQRIFFVARFWGGVNRSAIAAIADGARRSRCLA